MIITSGNRFPQTIYLSYNPTDVNAKMTINVILKPLFTKRMMTSWNGNIFRVTGHSPHKGQWREALMFSLICVWINGWINNREVGDLRRHRAHYEVIVMGWPSNRKISWILEAARIGTVLDFSNPLSFDRNLCSIATDVSVKFQSDTVIIISNFVTSRLNEIWW